VIEVAGSLVNRPLDTAVREEPMSPYRYHAGRTPLLISMPHAGVFVPDGILAGMTEQARQLPDTDWHVDRLYDFAKELGASLLIATHSRYVIDVNRPPDDRPLYPGADNTELCPTTTFGRTAIYAPGCEPDDAEIKRRLDAIWRPYHAQLASSLQQAIGRHGIALLYEAHTIRSRVPRFFKGRLPDLNLGTAHGTSAARALEARMVAVCQSARSYTSILNGRFVGGYITRHYARPGDNIHAVQLELSQRTYMDEEPPFPFDQPQADRVRPVLRQLLQVMLDWAGEVVRDPA
jgi:N-formylglutamate deformylase